ncbi:MAG: hypothetical protein LQ350_002139 [Teloschistes chrysophthalmus]|nr:MAG: hypothetical protein LQ350_002139 [Niorma chrysophthalma]
MAPSVNQHISSQLRQLIYYHLDNHLLRNALFFAGRLTAHDPKSSDATYLISLCYFRLGQIKSAYDSSRRLGSTGTNLGCSYIFAQACLDLGKYVEGATALEKSKGQWVHRNTWSKHTETRRQHLPDAAAIYCLQGKLWQSHRDSAKAIENYAEALKLNPFMWDAFIALSDLGVNILVQNIFQMTPEMRKALQTTEKDEYDLETLEELPPPNALTQSQSGNNLNISQLPGSNDPFSISKNRLNGEVKPSLAMFDKFNIGKASITPIGGGDLDMSTLDTPSAAEPNLDTAAFLGKPIRSQQAPNHVVTEPPAAPTRKARPGQGLGTGLTMDDPPKMKSNSIRTHSRSKADSDEASNGRPPSINNGIGERKRTITGQAASAPTSVAVSNGSVSSNDPSAPQRRSVRLFNHLSRQSGKAPTMSKEEMKKKLRATGTKGRSANTGTVGRVVSGNRIHGDSMDVDGKEQRKPLASQSSQSLASDPKPKTVYSEGAKEKEALLILLDLFRKLACGYFAQCHYKSVDAARIYNSINMNQRDTPWVLSQIGRAHFELGQYADAEKIYARLRILAPSRVEDMELYSTCLWHLGREIDLAFLAHETIDTDRNSPQAWCVVGNSFAVQKDHDHAVKCFKRATQLNPRFAYAYTLQGHEHMANEELDKALAAFRTAIAVDNRHFNGWYGLGKVFEQQGKYEVAEQHFRTAAVINPTSGILLTCIGGMLEKRHNYTAALDLYIEACKISPLVLLPRMKQAKMLEKLKRPREAFVELEKLKALQPDDATVWFWLGKVSMALGERSEAIRYYTVAGNLDPKLYIKEQMERMEEVEMEDHDPSFHH